MIDDRQKFLWGQVNILTFGDMKYQLNIYFHCSLVIASLCYCEIDIFVCIWTARARGYFKHVTPYMCSVL